MTAVTPRTRPGRQARPGDVTGAKREALAREHSDEIKAREGEISLLTAEKTRSEDEDIIDPLERVLISDVDGSVRKMDPEPEDEGPRFINPSGSAVEIEELPDEKTADKARVVRAETAEYLNEKVIIRVNCDLEDVTLGYGTTVSFLEGRRYRVPRWVERHLAEKGLTW